LQGGPESLVLISHGRFGISRARWDDEEEALSAEEVELQREEQEENSGGRDTNFGTSPESYTEVWSDEDKQLKREEEQENDDWWFT
jgi:hypothetical protein